MVKHEIKKLTHYEYWPFWLFYIPMIPVWIYYGIKAKSLAYFTSVNPSMEHGGFTEYSKFNIQNQVSQDKRPIHQLLTNDNLELDPFFKFPFIAKPDIGERGVNVQLIRNQKEWDIYKRNATGNIIVQEFVDLPNEYGIFYAKLPNEKTGKILSITGKKFLTFKGDGKLSLREFIESDSRAYFNKAYLYMKYNDIQDLILPEGESMILEHIGNHNRGTYFYDETNLITPELEQAINNIVSNIKGFYYGRLDIKAKDDETLKKGEFIVIEINGSASEATHIYDMDFSLIDAYKEVLRHLNIQYKISKQNIKNGIKPTSFINFIKAVKNHMLS